MCSLQALPRPHRPFARSCKGISYSRVTLWKGIVTKSCSQKTCLGTTCTFSFQCHCSGKDCNEKMDFGSSRRNRTKDTSTSWWQKIEYLNWGPDGTCTPLVGSSLHSWNQLTPWREAERPSSFGGQCRSHVIGILRERFGGSQSWLGYFFQVLIST